LVLVQLRKKSGLLVHEWFSGCAGDINFGFESPISADVQKLVPVLDHYTADQESPMAVRGILFSTHQSDAELLDSALQPIDSRAEQRVCGDAAVKDAARLVVVGGILWAAAEFVSEKQIFDSGFAEGALHNLAVELRGIARIRC
jgi:hypothetical protein